jgi:uncharacterized protein with ParB-like and HNH nuclease domain
MNTDSKDDLEFVEEDFENPEDSPVEELQKILSYNVANTTEVLKLKIDSKEIDLQPEFQRAFVWDINKASLFIDSLIIGLPIPSVFLGKQKEDDSYIVIDGQQRLKSVYFYLQGDFESNGEKQTFALTNLKGRSWEGKTYAELDEKYKRRIRNSVINTTIIEDINSQPKVVHDLFHRLNTGGVALTDQEIRNCVYSGLFNKQLLYLNKTPKWRELINVKIPDKRLRDVELILRFFALLHEVDSYQPSMKIFLSNFQDNNKNNLDFLSSNQSLFIETTELIADEIGQDAFRTTRAINKSMCDSIMVAIAQTLKSGQRPTDLKEKHKRLLEDKEYEKYTQSGTSTQRNVQNRINLARNYFLGLK